MVHSTDPELAEAVIAELRAIGDDGMNADGPVLVVLTREGDSILVQVQQPGRTGEVRVPAPHDSGLGMAPTRALAIVEVVRSLVAGDVDETAAPPRPELPNPAPPPSPAPTPYLIPALPAMSPAPAFPLGGDQSPDDDDEETVLRLGFTSGVDYADPVWSVVSGVTLRGQANPYLTFLGGLRYGHDFDDGGSADFRIHRIQARFGAAWEILGANAPITPTLGATARGELLMFRISNNQFPKTEGAALAFSPLATAGLSFGRPFRGRIDVEAGVRAAAGRIDGATRKLVTDSPVPVVGLTAGFEYDVVTHRPAPVRAARR